MPPESVRPLWQGRALALVGILLVAANLRTAVAALSPILGEVRADVPFDSVGVGLLGALPPVCFAVFGVLAPRLTHRLSLEATLVAALAVMLVGHLARALAPAFPVLVAGSAVTFAGMAVGNVVLPPIVKRYFPDRVGLMTSLYATILSICTLVPPLVAVPVADSVGWRVSLGMWGAITVVAVVPWVAVLAGGRRARRADPDDHLEEVGPALAARVSRAPLAWAMGILFATSSLNAYAFFAWLPELMQDVARVGPAGAGALLSLYAGMGIPAAILVPIVLVRTRRVGLLVAAGVGCFLTGDLGLLLAPAAAPWLWAALTGLGPLLFPLCLTLINLRTRTHGGAIALSGFTQGLGYAFGATGPLVVGVLHQVSGGWTWPLIFLTATAFAAIAAGVVAARPGMLEDQLGRAEPADARVG